MAGEDRLGVLVAAGGAGWESAALAAFAGERIAVVKRCVDLADLLATAGSGQAEVAVVAAELAGLDAAAITYLIRHDVRTVAVGAEGLRSLRRIGVVDIVAADDLDRLPAVVREAAVRELVEDPAPEPGIPGPAPSMSAGGRVVAVWGPTGAPGRTTVAAALAVELARRHAGKRRVLLADLDPYAGALAQHLGVLDEGSGLLAAARLINAGALDERSFAPIRRRTGDGVELLSGLPRADRWIEVRENHVTEIIDHARDVGEVVLDTGFCLEESEGDYGRAGSGRNRMTLEALAAADEIVVVGAADPVGLTRLARGLVELHEIVPAVPLRVVVNRMRDSLGWRESDIQGMIEGFARPLGVHFLPEDRVVCDRAVVRGTAITAETGSRDGGLLQEMRALTDAVFPDSPRAEPSGSRRRGQVPKRR